MTVVGNCDVCVFKDRFKLCGTVVAVIPVCCTGNPAKYTVNLPRIDIMLITELIYSAAYHVNTVVLAHCVRICRFAQCQ